MEMQIWPCSKKVKDQPRVIIWTNLVDLVSMMLYTKIQPQSFLGSGVENFKEFLPYTGMAAILINGLWLLYKVSIPL